MEKDVKRIDRLQPLDLRTKRVGVYCRVSDKYNSELHSLASQASGLVQYVHRQPYKVVADIFIDIASGADVDKRPEFQRMLQSAHDGKIEYVVTKQ